jgi:mRNA-degrading endonuclease RelE of RelBE toxin-antitoxin system
MEYQVVVPKKVQKEIDNFPAHKREKIFAIFAVIANNPFIGKKLGGKRKDEWSYRVWSYRVLYKIYKKELVVLIVKTDHRQGVY